MRKGSVDEFESKSSIFSSTQIKQQHYSVSSQKQSQTLKLPHVETDSYATKMEQQEQHKKNMMKNLKILVKKCVAEQENHKKLMNEFNHA